MDYKDLVDEFIVIKNRAEYVKDYQICHNVDSEFVLEVYKTRKNNIDEILKDLNKQTKIGEFYLNNHLSIWEGYVVSFYNQRYRLIHSSKKSKKNSYTEYYIFKIIYPELTLEDWID